MSEQERDPQTEAEAGESSEAHGTLMSLMGAGGVEADPAADEADASAGSTWLGQGAVLGGIALLATVAAVLAMRTVVSDPGASNTLAAEDQAKIETYLGKSSNPDALAEDDPLRPGNLKRLFGDTDAVLAMFSRDLSESQVPIGYVKKNPFKLPIGEKPASKNNNTRQQQAKQRLRELRQKLASLNLQSVMGGENPVAVINGELYQKGETVGPFTIERVNRVSLKLRADDRSFTLNMDKGGDDDR